MKSKKTANESENGFKYTWWLIGAIAIFTISICAILFLPWISEIYSSLIHEKVNPENLNVSRIDVLKITISLIGPFLTFIVFINTLNIQKESKKDRERDKKAEEKRKNLDDANREFYALLELFIKNQKKLFEMHGVKNCDVVTYLYDYAINIICEADNRLINSYNGSYTRIYAFTDEDRGDYTGTSITEIIKNLGIDFTDLKEKSEKIISYQYDSVYHITSSYFKVLHRILKNLNYRYESGYLNEHEYLNYIGVLRSQLSSKELVIILVNALYIERGLGLAIEAVGTDIFGDKRDFKKNQHFNIPSPKVTDKDLEFFIYNQENITKRIGYRERLKNEDDSQNKNFINFK